jgi:hypothetical protein
MQAFLNDFPDFKNSPVLYGALIQEEKKVIAEEMKLGKNFYHEDPVTNFNMRLRKVAKDILEWRDNLAKTAAGETKKENLEEKKQNIHNLKTATSKTVQKPKVQMTQEQWNEYAVQDMIKKRNRIKSGSPIVLG